MKSSGLYRSVAILLVSWRTRYDAVVHAAGVRGIKFGYVLPVTLPSSRVYHFWDKLPKEIPNVHQRLDSSAVMRELPNTLESVPSKLSLSVGRDVVKLFWRFAIRFKMQQQLLLSILASSAASGLVVDVDYASFLNRSDLVWEWDGTARAPPPSAYTETFWPPHLHRNFRSHCFYRAPLHATVPLSIRNAHLHYLRSFHTLFFFLHALLEHVQTAGGAWRLRATV